MRFPTLSVVIPARNEADYIGPCLDAVLAQTEPVDEIVVVDNASNDATSQILHSYAEHDSRITIVVESERGVAIARNSGFEYATGDIIGRIDADTRVRPEWSATLKSYFADPANDLVGAVTGLNNSYDSPFRAIKRTVYAIQLRRGKMGGGRRMANMHGANCALRKTTWEKVRHAVSTRTDIHEDFDLALCIHKTGEHITQLSDMWVDISPRRALADPISYTAYIRAAVTTCKIHGFRGRRAWLTIYTGLAGYWLAHAVIWLPYRAYDPLRKRFSLRYLISGPGTTPPAKTQRRGR